MAWTTEREPPALESATFHDGKVIAIPLVDSSIDSSDMMWIPQGLVEQALTWKRRDHRRNCMML